MFSRNKKPKIAIFILAIMLIFANFLVFTNSVRAQTDVWGDAEETKMAIEDGTGLESTDVTVIIARIIKIFLGFLGLAAVILIMYGGYLWMTAGGNDAQIDTAKKFLINAAIGLVIILSSYALASYFLDKAVEVIDGDGGGGGGGAIVIPPGPNITGCLDPAETGGGCTTQECIDKLKTTPYLCKISPKSGAKGTYVTIRGYHFDDYADGISKVKFGEYDAEIVVCPGNNKINWKDNRIVIKVPDIDIGVYSVSVIDKDAAKNDILNDQSFTITDDVVSPGIACIVPDEGKENTEIKIYGDYFGEDSQDVIFSNDVFAAVGAGDWTKNLITTKVPAGAMSGDVFVKITSIKDGIETAQKSNEYPFKISCDDNSDCSLTCCCHKLECAESDKCAVGEGESCEQDGVCGDDNCANGLFCNGGCVCEKMPGEGEDCYTGGVPSCADGKCDNSSKCDEKTCKCVGKPVIDYISPVNSSKAPTGAKGDFITIYGKNFGVVDKIYENILSNNDFEQGEVGRIPDNWSYSKQSHSRIGISREEAKSGQQSVKIHQDPDQPWPGNCGEELCTSLDNCTWLADSNQCTFVKIDECHDTAPAIYNEGEKFCWPNTNNVMWARFVYDVSDLDWKAGDKYIMKFYYKGNHTDEAHGIDIRLAYHLGWGTQCGRIDSPWGKQHCAANGIAGGYPTCAKQSTRCCLHAPVQESCYQAKPLGRVTAGNYDKWTVYSKIFEYTEDMQRLLDKDGNLHNEIGLAIGYNSTGPIGTNFYIDDFVIAKVPNQGTVFFWGTGEPELGIFPTQLNPLCISSWKDDEIIIAVPEGAASGPIEVVAESGLSDRTDDDNGQELPNFQVSNEPRPGLCEAFRYNVAKEMEHKGKFKQDLLLAGVNLEGITEREEIVFGSNDEGFNPYSGPSNTTEGLISGIIIPNIKKGQTSVFVKDEGGTESNALRFTILESTYRPKINYFLPKAGHKGDYVNIFGNGFGSEQGRVFFGSEDFEADYSFPSVCLNVVWKDSRIIVKVPEGLDEKTSKKLIIKTKDGQEIISDDSFYIGDYCSKDYSPCPCTADSGSCSTAVVPGLCKIFPDNGHEGTKVGLWGENFGSSNGFVRFNTDEGEKDVSADEWKKDDDADYALAEAPADLLPGHIKILSAKDGVSNGMQFSVLTCQDNTECLGTNVCCGADSEFEGSCLPTMEDCRAKLKIPTNYAWKFNTKSLSEDQCFKLANKDFCEDDADKLNCCWETGDSECRKNGLCSGQTIPLVVEKCAHPEYGCAENEGIPSPSPWEKHPKGKQSCVDTLIAAKFTEKMDSASFVDAHHIERCNTCAEEDCDIECSVYGNSVDGSPSVSERLWKFNLDENLEKNTWYKVSLDGDKIKSEEGVNLDGDKDGEPGGKYVWTFKTRNDVAICKIGCVIVEPSEYTATTTDLVKYDGYMSAEDNKCIVLKDRGDGWNWSSSDEEKANISNSSDCCKDNPDTTEDECVDFSNWVCALPVAETGVAPVKITGSISDKKDFGFLNIDFVDFEVQSYWPACSKACLNAEVGASFSAMIDASSISGDNIELYKCFDEKCSSFYDLIAQGGEVSEKEIIFTTPASEFDVNTYYRAIILGGDSGIKNMNGGTLNRLNHNINSKNIVPDNSFEKNTDWTMGGASRTSDKFYSGAHSLEANGANIEAAVVLKKLEAGRKYKLKGSIYNSLKKGKAYIDVSELDEGCLDKTISTNWNNKWEHVQCEFELAEDIEDAKILIKTDEEAEGYAWFDDIELFEIEGANDAYSWVFKTSDKICEVNDVDLNPKSATVSRVGDSVMYRAIAKSTPDKECSEKGQRLNSMSYDWNWASSDTDIASVSKYPECGNGILETGEDCDDANIDLDDGCANCLNTGTASCDADLTVNCCGNKKVETGEDCDDGKTNDGCSSICLNEGSNAIYGSLCGNGILEKGEDCDDKNVVDGDGCDSDCLNNGTSKATTTPYQLVEAVGGPAIGSKEASAEITAETGGEEDTGEFKIECGYKYGGDDDSECGDIASNAVGTNGCCGERPKVVSVIPNDLDNFCINGVIEVEFDQLMSEKSLKEQPILQLASGGVACGEIAMLDNKKERIAGETKFLGDDVINGLKEKLFSVIKFFTDIFIDNRVFSYAPIENRIKEAFRYKEKHLRLASAFVKTAQAQAVIPAWCPADTKTTVLSKTIIDADGNEKNVTVAKITASSLLLKSHSYKLDFNGLKNKAGIPLQDNTYNKEFTTGGVICEIDRIDVFIDYTSPLKPASQDIFICAGRNDCGSATDSIEKDNDYDDSLVGNQHLYRAAAVDKKDRAISANYVWLEHDPQKAIEFSDNGSGNVLVTANRVEDAEALIEIGAYDTFGAGTAATTTVNVRLFMCEKPWPEIETFPHYDNDYNFSTYYCKDEGNPELPDFGNISPICNSAECKDGAIREYLWVEE